jgi:murein DD-endopeptidase MepM/ murein hydrolase activator NlpD
MIINKIYFQFIFFLFFFSIITLNAQTPAFRHAVIPENPQPGEPVTIALTPAVGAKSAALILGGKRLARAAFFPIPAEAAVIPDEQVFMLAVLTVPSTAKPGKAVIAIETAGGVAGEIPITIAEREFVAEEIALITAFTGIRPAPDPQKTAESDQLWAILNKTGKEVYCLGSFSPPVTSNRRTSFYGDRRVYQYSNGTSDTSIHAGVDYGVPTGTPVKACGPGKVVLARSRIVTGNSVIIEHFPGCYSLYYHLDKIEVAEGAVVGTGAQLGLSGATGLATGPHLHWEIRVSGENTDPDAFIIRPILDKNAILSKIYQ